MKGMRLRTILTISLPEFYTEFKNVKMMEDFRDGWYRSILNLLFNLRVHVEFYNCFRELSVWSPKHHELL